MNLPCLVCPPRVPTSRKQRRLDLSRRDLSRLLSAGRGSGVRRDLGVRFETVELVVGPRRSPLALARATVSGYLDDLAITLLILDTGDGGSSGRDVIVRLPRVALQDLARGWSEACALGRDHGRDGGGGPGGDEFEERIRRLQTAVEAQGTFEASAGASVGASIGASALLPGLVADASAALRFACAELTLQRSPDSLRAVQSKALTSLCLRALQREAAAVLIQALARGAAARTLCAARKATVMRGVLKLQRRLRVRRRSRRKRAVVAIQALLRAAAARSEAKARRSKRDRRRREAWAREFEARIGAQVTARFRGAGSWL